MINSLQLDSFDDSSFDRLLFEQAICNTKPTVFPMDGWDIYVWYHFDVVDNEEITVTVFINLPNNQPFMTYNGGRLGSMDCDCIETKSIGIGTFNGVYGEFRREMVDNIKAPYEK